MLIARSAYIAVVPGRSDPASGARDGVRVAAVALIIDVALLLVFAAIGRRNHDEGDTLAGVIGTAWPFVAGWLLGATAVGLRRAPLAVRRALGTWAVALPTGLVLRGLDRGDAPPVSFAIVALLFTLVTLVGWRVVAGLRTTRRAADTTS